MQLEHYGRDGQVTEASGARLRRQSDLQLLRHPATGRPVRCKENLAGTLAQRINPAGLVHYQE